MMCSRCVMNTTAPISFDEKGICNYCYDWVAKEKARKIEKTNLPWRIHEIKKSKRKYDCLLGLSGGVDSSLCLHYCIEQGLKPLCFSMDNGWNDPKADENIMRMVETLKVPFQKVVLDIPEFKAIQESFIRAGLSNVEVVTDHVIRALSYQVAAKNGIKWIISGGNHATEGIMPDEWSFDANDLKHIKAVYGKKIKNIPTMSLIQYIYYRFIGGIKKLNLLDYYSYNRSKAIELLKEKYGYKSYGFKHCESFFTAWFQNYYLPAKFGYDKRLPHFSTLINSGQITRKQAVEALKLDLDYPDISSDFPLVKEFMNIPKRKHEDFPNSQKIRKFLSKIYAIYKK